MSVREARWVVYVPVSDLAAANRRIEELEKVVAEQANDEGLWFVARTASEGYLQQELRRLHRVIEHASNEADAG